MLCALYNGHVHVMNYENQQMVKDFEVCDLPVRCARFVARKNWIITGSDDMQVSLRHFLKLAQVSNVCRISGQSIQLQHIGKGSLVRSTYRLRSLHCRSSNTAADPHKQRRHADQTLELGEDVGLPTSL